MVLSFKKAGLSPKIRWEVMTKYSTAIALIAAGLGMAIVPASLKNHRRIGVVYRSLISDLPMVEIFMAWKKTEASSILPHFLEVMQQSQTTY